MGDRERNEKSPSPERPHSPGRNYNYNDSRSPQRSPRGRSPGHGQSNSSPSRGRSGSPRGRDRSEKREAVNRGNNLYIGDLSSKTKTEDLEKKFSKYGKVMNCRLVTDPRAGQSRGFAFITLDTGEGADEAIKYVNGTDLDGSIIRVEKAKRGRSRTPTPGKYLGSDRSRRRDYRDDRRPPPRGYDTYYNSRDYYYRGGYSPDRYDRRYDRSPRTYERSRSPGYRNRSPGYRSRSPGYGRSSSPSYRSSYRDER